MVTTHRRSERSSGGTATPPSAVPGRPDEAVTIGARRVVAALAEAGGAPGRDEWLEVVSDCQSLINTLTAVQDAAIAEAARRESVWCEDGTLGETVHRAGRVTLDAADVIAPVIGASHAQAQRRVEQAVRLASGRVPVPADDRDVPEASGLGRLHDAMVAGQLDGYRAGVVAFELEGAPADVADAIVSALSAHFDDDAPGLRRRTRVLLNRISPDLVRERAKKARASTGLRRWVAEPGVDEWHGTFPSEDAAAAWAAIDRLAHDLVAAGTCSNVEQARGRALTDLVAGNATVDVQVVLTVPADTAPPEASRPEPGVDTHDNRHGGEDLIEVQGARPSEPLLVRRAWLRDHLPKATPRPRRDAHARSTDVRAVRPAHRGATRPRRRLRDRRIPTGRRARGAGPRPRWSLPVPRLLGGRPVLRPRPRAALADRPHRGAQPAVTLPATPPHQATTRLATSPGPRRHRHLDRPDRPGAHHRAIERLGVARPGVRAE